MFGLIRADAEPLYRRSPKIREKQLGRDHPNVAIVFEDKTGGQCPS
jgi:hypothetical protein